MSYLKIIQLVIVFSGIVSVSAFSQDYYTKTVIPGNKWSIKLEFGSNFPALFSEILVTCDTAHLNGKVYQSVLVTDDPSIECGPGGYVREDTIEQRIYFINRFDEDNVDEILIADFSLEIGDTFEFENGWKQAVEDVRYIDYHGSSQAKFIDFGLSSLEGFVEGHGRITTGIIDGCRTTQFPRLNGWEPSEEDCNTLTSTRDLERLNQVRVLPNPARDFLKVEVADDFVISPIQYDLISVMGSLIQKGELHNNNTIYLRDIPKGAYYLVLKRKEGQIVKKIMHY